MPAGVGLVEQQRGAFVEVFDLLGELQRQPGLDRDVFGQIGVVQLAVFPQLQGLGRGGQYRVGVAVRPMRRGSAGSRTGRAGPGRVV